jgi:hypothetical protein
LQDSLTGDIITDHKAIARRYLKSWFAIDVLATFPVDYIVRGVEVRGCHGPVACSSSISSGHTAEDLYASSWL